MLRVEGKKYPQKCVRNKRETVPVHTVGVVRTVLMNRYGWGVNAKNTLYHVLAKDTRDSLRYLEYALRYLDPHTYCMMLGSKKRT